MQKISRGALESVLWDADVDLEDGTYWNYGGRWGLKSQFNIVGDFSDVARFFVQLTQFNAELAYELSQNIPTDNMGRDLIFSFPDLEVAEDDDEEE